MKEQPLKSKNRRTNYSYAKHIAEMQLEHDAKLKLLDIIADKEAEVQELREQAVKDSVTILNLYDKIRKRDQWIAERVLINE